MQTYVPALPPFVSSSPARVHARVATPSDGGDRVHVAAGLGGRALAASQAATLAPQAAMLAPQAAMLAPQAATLAPQPCGVRP